jgi:murein DD-endopeptidase MepM/ murein hydrolase activator NlpD
MRPSRQTTRLLDAFSSLRRRLVGASVGGLLAATVLPAVLLAVVQPPEKGSGPLGGDKLALPLKATPPPSSFDEIKRRERIEGHLTPADIRRALIASRSQRKRILRAHPHFRLYKEAKRRYGVSWYLVAALHDERKAMSAKGVMAAARRLRDAGAGARLGRRAWRAVFAHYRRAGSAPTTASVVLERARAWKQLGVIPLPAGDKLATPVKGVVPGCGYFHCPRPGHLHNGLDLSAPAGTPIHAVQAGRVAILEGTGASSGYGNFVCLQHSPALASCYAHLSRFAPDLEVGREVGRGEVIGLVGCTGHCYGAHLHFEIRRGAAACSGCAVDPVPYLSGKVPDVPAPKLEPVRRPVSPAPSLAPAPAPAPAPVPTPTPAPAPAPAAPPAAKVGAPSAPSTMPTSPSREPGRRPDLAGGTPPSQPPAPPPAAEPPPPADPAPPPADTGGGAPPAG